jgi:hypothetical protein
VARQEAIHTKNERQYAQNPEERCKCAAWDAAKMWGEESSSESESSGYNEEEEEEEGGNNLLSSFSTPLQSPPT